MTTEAGVQQMPSESHNNALKDDVMIWADAYVSAATSNDADAMEQLLHENCIFIHSGAGYSSGDNHVRLMREGLVEYKTFEPRSSEVQIFNETTAVVTATIDAHVSREGYEIEGQFLTSRVYFKEGERWLLISAQSTRAPHSKT